MNIHTSTPFPITKTDIKPICSEKNLSHHIIQHQFHNEGTLLFNNTSEATVTSAESDNFINYLNNCSISKISNSTDEHDILHRSKTEDSEMTLIADTPEVKPVNVTSENKSIEDRKLSTTVKPFSFEMREVEKQKHKQARLQYKIVSEQLNNCKPQALVAPRIATLSPFNHKKSVTKKVANQNALSPQSCPGLKFNIPPKSKTKIITNVPQVTKPQKDIIVEKGEGHRQNHKIEPWKKKPYEILLPKRKLTVPHSPKLMTAQRAHCWKVREEMLQKDVALRNTKSHKQPINKAAGVPSNQRNPARKLKRPTGDPMIPILPKRRRI